jgi:hypothetical protein
VGWVPFHVVNCTFTGNQALYGGHGGAVWTNSDLRVVNSVFELNDATPTGFWTDEGGGNMWFEFPGYGGAMYNAGKDATCVNCTFVGNAAYDSGEDFTTSGYGGAIYATGGQTAELTVTNCILWDNLADVGTQIEVASGNHAVTYSDVEGGWTGPGNKNVDPQFTSQYRLSTGSPCIDVGDSNEMVNGYDVDDDNDSTERTPDLDHRDRILYGASAFRVDMGAYEHSPDCVGDINDDQVVDTADLLILLGNWGTSGPGDLDENGVVNTADLLMLLANWGPCGPAAAVPPPQSIQDCISRYLGDPVMLEACIEGMIRAGTP